MAPKKSTTPKKTSSTKKNGTKSRSSKPTTNRRTQVSSKRKTNAKQNIHEYEDMRAVEIACSLAFSFVLSVFLLACLSGVCGVLGKAIQNTLFIIFGWTAWIVPFFLFLGTIFYLINCENPMTVPKIVSVVLSIFFFNSMISVFAEDATTCGVISSTISEGLKKVTGSVGAILIFFAGFFLSIAFAFGKNFVKWLREYNQYRDEMEEEYESYSKKEDYKKPSYRITPKRTKQTGFQNIDLKEVAQVYDEQILQKQKQSMPVKKVPPVQPPATGMNEILPEVPEVIDTPEILVSKQMVHTEVVTPDTTSKEKTKKPLYIQEMENKFGKSVQVPPDPKMAEPKVEKPKIQTMPQPEEQKEPKKQPVQQPVVKPAQKKTPPPPKTISVEEARKRMEEERANKANKESTVSNVPTDISEYKIPPIELLRYMNGNGGAITEDVLMDNALKLQQTLKSFGVSVQTGSVICGPTVTRYELFPEQGVKVSKITSLADDLKLSLAAKSIRIEAPIPGKSAVGIEIPNDSPVPVAFRDLIESKAFSSSKSNTSFAVGKDISGKTIVTDIAKMPHLLIAGATGSGKSVCINTLIMSIIYKANPNDVKLIMIDPKVVELSVYNGIPHLFIPVVTDPKKAAAALNWAVMEMMERYQKFADAQVRNIKGYNDWVKKNGESEEEGRIKMPQLIIIVDELADLMMVASKEVEDAICRLAQLARAAGIHLVIATQRPSVNVITGTIKANIPSRIAFSVSSAIDSRTILDRGGAEKLLGKGDMLFYPSGYSDPVRLQGAFVSDEEVSSVVEYLKAYEMTHYNDEINNKVTNAANITETKNASAGADGEEGSNRDEYFIDAGTFIIEAEKASVGMLQRKFSVGFNRAARIMDQLCEAGVVGEAEGTKPRQILMTLEEFQQIQK